MAEEQTSREILSQLVERLDHLERLLQAQTARLYAVERRLGLEAPPEQPRWPPLHETPADERPETRRDAPPQTPPREGVPPAPAREASTGEAARPPTPRAKTVKGGRDLESLIGGSWFSWVGIIAVTFGVAFALKYAFENEWVGPGARVGLGALAGLGLLGVGERLRRKGLRPFAYVLSGGGVLILYLSIYAAYNFYGLISQPPAFLMMTLVTAGAVLLAVRQNALPVAVLALVGGFLTPVLISTGRDNQVALFTYVSLLDAGVLAVGYFRRWRTLDFLSFAATVLMTFGWAVIHYDDEKLWTTLFFLALLFTLYSLLAVFHNVLPRRRSRWFDVALLASNATFYFAASYGLLYGAGYERALPAALALVLSAYFGALSYAARGRCSEDRLLAYAYVGAAVTFLTAAVAIQLELQWVTIVWAVEGLMLTWVGLRTGEGAARRAAVAVFGVASAHWLFEDAQQFAFSPQSLADGTAAAFVPVANSRAVSCLVLVGALALAARLYRSARYAEPRGGRQRVPGEGEREALASLYTLAANALALTLLTLDLSDYFGRQKALSEGLAAERAENARQFSLTALWAIYGGALAAYGMKGGMRGGFRAARYAGLALLALASVKVLVVDLAFYDAAWHTPVFNHTFMAFALVVGAFAAVVRLYARGQRAGEAEAVMPVLIVAANVLALVALSAEAVGFFEARAVAGADAAGLREVALSKQLSLSVVWALYGAGLLLAGRARRARLLRLLGLALLGLTALKVFVLDLSALDRAYRIVSFIVLGAVLLAVSYLYQKSQQRASAAEPEEAGEADEAEPQSP
ncbi:MAG TPA: DUF2339 domain-containing protein [Pyrinomonadaceae bacterium]|jgi:uncharacterized membrane protein